MREHRFLLPANRPNVNRKVHKIQNGKQYRPRPERGGGQVLFPFGPWPGLLERLWFVAPFYFRRVEQWLFGSFKLVMRVTRKKLR